MIEPKVLLLLLRVLYQVAEGLLEDSYGILPLATEVKADVGSPG